MLASLLSRPVAMLVGKGLLGLALSAGAYYSVTWVVDKLESVGRMEAQLRESSSAIEEMSARFKVFNRVLNERAVEGQELRSLFSDLRSKAQEIQNACDVEPLGSEYVDQLRYAAEAAASGDGLRSTEEPDSTGRAP